MIKTKAFPLGPVLLPIGEGSPLLAIFVACSIISVAILYLPIPNPKIYIHWLTCIG